MKNKFTSFVKTRIMCSVPGNIPFDYNEIRKSEQECFFLFFLCSNAVSSMFLYFISEILFSQTVSSCFYCEHFIVCYIFPFYCSFV